jgi:hypothetical protein
LSLVLTKTELASSSRSARLMTLSVMPFTLAVWASKVANRGPLLMSVASGVESTS